MLPTNWPTREVTVNWNVIAGNCKQLKGHLRAAWGTLIDDNLEANAGRRQQLAGRLQVTYGVAEDQVALQVRTFEEIRRGYQPKIPA
jgi:uncharacterized protein YjbJ (UPF0337 family)